MPGCLLPRVRVVILADQHATPSGGLVCETRQSHPASRSFGRTWDDGVSFHISKPLWCRIKPRLTIKHGHVHRLLSLGNKTAGTLIDSTVMSTEMNSMASPLASKLMHLVYDHCRWHYIIYLILAWEIHRIVWTFWWKAPVSSIGPYSLCIEYSSDCYLSQMS